MTCLALPAAAQTPQPATPADSPAAAATAPAAPAGDASQTAATPASSDSGQTATQTTTDSAAAPGPAAAPTPAGKTPPPWAMRPSPLSKNPGLLTLGYENLDLSGSSNKFFQYATPPQGLFLDELRYVPFTPVGNVGVVDVRAFGEADYRDYLQYDYLPNWTEFEGLMTHSQFFDGTPQIVNPSERAVQQFAIEQRLGENFLLSTHYRMDQVDDSFDIPLDPLHQRTRYNDVVASGQFARGFVNLTFSDWHYFDRTQLLPDTDVKRWQEDYERSIGPQTLGEQFRWLAISQAGQPDAHIEIASLSDDVAIGDSSDASLVLRQDRISEPVVQNAYYREQQSATTRVSGAWATGNASVGLQERSAQRVRADHTYVDVPEWQTVLGRVSQRLGDSWHLSLRGSMQNLWKAPVMDTDDSDDLLWSNIQDAEARVDGDNDTISGYVSWAYHRTANNSARSTRVTQDLWSAGGNWQATPKISVSGDISYEKWLADNPSAMFPILANFMPANEIASVGVNCVASPRLFFTVNYSGWLTWNDNPLLLQDGNTTGTFLTLQANYRSLKGQEFGLTISPWAYHDSLVDQLDYQATVAEVTVSTPF
jgi:hypothetical protein